MRRLAAILAFFFTLVGAGSAYPLSIVDSKHNLSAAGPGTAKAESETQICIFCHAPHNVGQNRPLWNRSLSSGISYTTYSSTTAKATFGQPSGASKLCLSCHDGTIALGLVLTPGPITMAGDITTMPEGTAKLGIDLSDDHPISFAYDNTLFAAANGELEDPANLTGSVRLDSNGLLQCSSCHDAHDDQYGSFLRVDNVASALCRTCHVKSYWQNSSHRSSTKGWNDQGTNPWPHTNYTTVADNACENCHRPHSAGGIHRLLNYPIEENNCYPCHNGNVAAKNIESEFDKSYVHPVASTTGVHDAAEDPGSSPRHVECQDCHNPHAANDSPASAPNASGRQAGVGGINLAGAPVKPINYLYELCFRCHGDSNSGAPLINRHFDQTNTRLEFNTSNASYHPVAGAGKNPNVPSLLPPYTTSSVIYCTDCHNNNQGPGAGGSGPNGPHGSIYRPILERRLDLTTGWRSRESAEIYALCYKCHDRDSILSNDSFKRHDRHIDRENIPCTACHDPHGVTTQNHLINFDTSVASPNSKGEFRFEDRGTFAGACYLRCHYRDHDPSDGTGEYD
ncbi:MAG: cytochrome c3 family protein [Thermodesulfobacteriota bacterium]